MSETFSLNASPREVIGKKVKQLRRQGYVPAVIYGPDFETSHILLEHKPLRQLLLQAGGTHLIELDVDGTTVTTLAREVQRDPIRGDILHVDFYRVAMDRAIRAQIPLVIVGDNPLVGRDAVLAHPISSVEVECLPGNLPTQIDVDITTLTEIGAHILLGDLALPRGVTVLGDPSEMVAKLDYPHITSEEDEALLFGDGPSEPEVIKKGKTDDEA